ncbi:IclR family transcriptional regulator [Telmatospirillum siberiense]|uniref:IclR family transcriptional regulator n=1 Tax=Telmatospirillum siberiense TaxID=382514 RepID=UPI001F5303B8|nr:IclR family transcriptional regulator [Telmatospirillum siberiense]
MGLRLYELGNVAISHLDVKRESLSELYQLRQVTNLTCHLGVLDGNEAIYLAKLESPSVLSVKTWEGKRLSLHSSAVGKALLSDHGEAEIDAIFPSPALPTFTRNTVPSVVRLKEELRTVRQRGWAFDDEEELENIRCVAAPIRDVHGEVVAAVSVVGLKFQIPDERVETLAGQVIEICTNVSKKLGFEPGATALSR